MSKVEVEYSGKRGVKKIVILEFWQNLMFSSM